MTSHMLAMALVREQSVSVVSTTALFAVIQVVHCPHAGIRGRLPHAPAESPGG
jgi:hypothetical protein